MVDPLGAVVEEIQGLGGVPRDGLPDPHDQQGQDGLHPPEAGAPVKDVAELSWYSFRVFMPDWAFQAHIPREQRQYLGNWFKESTADVYTREKRHVMCALGPGPPEAPVHATRGRKGGVSRPRT